MRIHPHRFAMLAGLAGIAFAQPLGCSAGTEDGQSGGGPVTGAGPGSGSPQGTGGGSTQNVGGGFVTSGGGQGGQGGSIVNPCGTECGPTELCDGVNKGIDDDCDGTVDEDCPCGPGESDSCFKGDPSYLGNPTFPTCQPGTMACTENGDWGPCLGGNHADAIDECFAESTLACHPINAVPFQTVDLFDGTGTFDDDADMSTFTVACPMGVMPCPAVSGVSDFQALQSGEYTVTYTKTVGMNVESCDFPLYVGARGLRVELSWNWGGSGKDIDFHLHQPSTTTAWAVSGAQQDCGYGNCKAYSFVPTQSPNAPSWFPPGNMPPDPVNWYDAPNDQEDLCYYAPQGYGATWSMAAQGCHSPRLDVDNISCDVTETDPTSFNFCSPENINVDYPPQNEWIRVGAFMFSSFTTPGLTPNVKIYCDGALRAELGSKGFFDPETPIVWDASQARKWWLVADVVFKQDECDSECIVRPLYQNDDAVAKLPVYYTESGLVDVGPPYAPLP